MLTQGHAGRFRLGPPSSSGSTRLVTDTIRSESFWVYRPTELRQQLGGHDAGRWYFRPLSVEGDRPVSIPYPSAEAALRGLADTQTFKDLTR